MLLPARLSQAQSVRLRETSNLLDIMQVSILLRFTTEREAHGSARHDRSCRRRIDLRVALFRSAEAVG